MRKPGLAIGLFLWWRLRLILVFRPDRRALECRNHGRMAVAFLVGQSRGERPRPLSEFRNRRIVAIVTLSAALFFRLTLAAGRLDPGFRLIVNGGIVRIVFGEFYRDPKIYEFSRAAGIELVDLSRPLSHNDVGPAMNQEEKETE